MSAQKKEEINLIPQKGSELTTAGRILGWLLSTFRIIVILTELIVMTAFLSRFWLDAQNSDLSDEIEQKQAILMAFSDFEREFKDTQKRLKIYSDYTSKKYLISDLLTKITRTIPKDAFLTSINLSENKIHLEAITQDEKSIQQTVSNLSTIDIFKEVNLLGIETDKENVMTLKFNLEILI